MPFAWFGLESVGDCCVGGHGPSGMFHRPLVRFRKPEIMTWLSFNMFTSYLVKMATQLLLQSWPMDMSEPVVMYLNTWAGCTLAESLLESIKVELKAGLIMCPLAT